MRQLWIKVPTGQGEKILRLAQEKHGLNLFMFTASDQEQVLDVVVMNVSNQAVSEVLQALEEQDQVEIIFPPQDVFPLHPPSSQVPEQIVNVDPRSPIEVWLNGLQSIGSWKSFLGYTVAASLIAWTGMYTDTIFLLVAAMLVAPFASPAMNIAMATATGDQTLLWRNLVRYFASLTTAVLVAAALSLLLQQQVTTTTMVQNSEISSIAMLLPLAAGAVGALNLTQSENNSLVPGTAVGVLIAASLAPPAVLIGMSAALGRWDMALNGGFLLLLQLVAINIAGSLVFRLYNIDPSGSRFNRGKPALFYLSLGVSLLLLAGLLVTQFWSSPALQRSTRAKRAAAVVQQVIRADPNVDLLETNLRFPRPSVEDQDKLLGVIYVQRKPETRASDQEIEESLRREIQARLAADGFNLTPLMAITVLDGP